MLDVGCGVGGTSRYLARNRDCSVTGITISGEQVRMARKISGGDEDVNAVICVSSKESEKSERGKVQFIELDADHLADYFKSDETKSNGSKKAFDAVWISEALSHFPNKKLFFENAFKVLSHDRGGKLIIADWFRKEELTEEELKNDIQNIERSFFHFPSI